jgi:putative transposase
MPRISRGLVGGCIYHVINRGNGGQVIFHKDADYEAFIDIMTEAKIRYAVKIFAFCLMPNHFHMVLMPRQAEDLSKWMQWLMTSHVRRYHRHYGTSGHVWQGRYKSFLIQIDSHLLIVLRYVEGNPLRAGLVNSAKDWLWSSYVESIGKRPRLLVDEVPIELPKDWSKYVEEPITEKELEKLRQSVNRQSPYGNPLWQVQVSKEFGLESTIRPIGRPREMG